MTELPQSAYLDGIDGDEASAQMAGYDRLIERMRSLQDRVHGMRAPLPVLERLIEEIDGSIALAARYQVPPEDRMAGHVHWIPGRSQSFAPPLNVVARSADEARGTFRFGAHHTGIGAVHGGAIAVAFDEIMALVTTASQPTHRTAFIRVDYRALVPEETELDFVAVAAERIRGKVLIRAEIRSSDRVLAQGEGLYIRPTRDPITLNVV